MTEDYNALTRNHTWALVPLVDNMQVGHKWIFNTKLHADRTLQKLKVRLVAKFQQIPRIEYLETFNPVDRKSVV